MTNTAQLGAFGDLSNSSLSFRNKLINGDMRVAQRPGVALVNNGVLYGGCDRWLCVPISFTAVTGGSLTRSALGGTTSGYGQWAAGLSTTGSGSLIFGQRIESINSKGLNGRIVTFSGILYQDTGNTVTVDLSLVKASVVDNFASGSLIGSTVSVSIPNNVSTYVTATFLFNSTDGDNGVAVDIKFTGLGALSSKNFAIGDCQLEVGPIATPFEQRPLGLELSLCQRYCWVQTAASCAYNYQRFGLCFAYNTITGGDCIISFPTIMRIPPAATFSAAGDFVLFDGINLFSITAIGVDTSIGVDRICVNSTSSGLTANRPYALVASNNKTATITYTAEL